MQPLAEVAEVVRRRAPYAAVHADAVQAAAWLDLPPLVAGAGLVSLSSHKVGGPQGVGALVVRPGTPLRARALGGGQERELRSGTHNVAGIAGFAAALAVVLAQREATAARVRALARPAGRRPGGRGAGATETGVPTGRPGCRGWSTCASRASRARPCCSCWTRRACAPRPPSACASGAHEASHVLAAMGVPPDRAGGRCGCRSAGRAPRPTSTTPWRSSRRPWPGCGGRRHEGARGHVRGRGLVGGRGPAAGGGATTWWA